MVFLIVLIVGQLKEAEIFVTKYTVVDLIITPCISCLPYAPEPEARPLGWLALKICT